jgi:hypothetical protein
MGAEPELLLLWTKTRFCLFTKKRKGGTAVPQIVLYCFGDIDLMVWITTIKLAFGCCHC